MDDKRKTDNHKDKFDENIERDGMGPVDRDSSEEKGYNKGKKKDKPETGEGIEEFIDNDPEFEDDDNDEDERDNR